MELRSHTPSQQRNTELAKKKKKSQNNVLLQSNQNSMPIHNMSLDDRIRLSSSGDTGILKKEQTTIII